jgi:hypothetical protein
VYQFQNSIAAFNAMYCPRPEKKRWSPEEQLLQLDAGCRWSGDADFNGAKNIAFLGRYVDRPGGSEGLPSIKAVLSGLLKAPIFRPE